MRRPGPAPRSVAERFWPKVNRSTASACWEWTAGTNRWGYGRLNVDAKRGPQLAHRISWELANGPIPDGLCVLHRCDNAPCVNPRHLYLGTPADNWQDCMARGRDVHVRGDANGKTKVTDVDLTRIRVLADAGLTQTAIAQQFRIHNSHVSRILSGHRRSPATQEATA